MLYLYVYIYMQASNPSSLKFPKERSFSSGNFRTIFGTINYAFSARCTARSCYKENSSDIFTFTFELARMLERSDRNKNEKMCTT
ncbi:hypothetical protein ALC56_07559 [Trachymyrmex septentrionalis]|uniref:Uncharacterized protein n=1 Tax=Trachymyrmex septentrionalis TaxID=34720 RepID=A0A151JVQ6_9HYME|nr:hypothetical protein ALC56_07559 [Trachymyrmex septentrionalis]